MKNLLFAIMLLASVVSYGQTTKTYYCVQVCSTENPHLLKPEMVSILPDKAMIEHVKIGEKLIARIIFVYETKEEQITSHCSWLKQWHDAMMIERSEEQVLKLQPLFTYE